MRVVSGTAKGKNLLAVPGDSTRPILDRVKTALFDIIRPRLTDTEWLDMFAGTGGVGIEALSQGAKSCVFLDLNRKAVETIEKNLSATRLRDRGEVRNADAFGYVKKTTKSFDIIFVAPPQYKGIWIEAVKLIAEYPAVLKAGGIIIVQIDPKEYEPLELSQFSETDQRKYGNSVVVFFERS